MGPQTRLPLPTMPYSVSTSWHCSKRLWPHSWYAYPPFRFLHCRWSGTVVSQAGTINISVPHRGNHLNLSFLCPASTQHSNVTRFRRHHQRGWRPYPLRSIWHRLLPDMHWHFFIRLYVPQEGPFHYIQSIRVTRVQGHCDRIKDSLWNKSSVWIDYTELRTRLNQFEMFEEYWKMSVLELKQCCSEWRQCRRKTMYK